MRGARLVLLSFVLLVPLALADSITAVDPLGDERTITNLQMYGDQPHPFVCHDATIDLASVRIERGSTVRVTYTYAGPIALPQLVCNDQAFAATDRTWDLQLGGNPGFFATATSGTGEPAVTCLRASNPGIGNSNCLAPVEIRVDGFSFELPTVGSLTYEGGQAGTYSITGQVGARTTEYSRVTVGTAPMVRVLVGALDSGVATLG